MGTFQNRPLGWAHHGGRAGFVCGISLLALLVSTGSGGFASPAFGDTSHLIVGFNATTPALVDSAASLGITTDVLYNGPPSPKSKLGKALARTGMTVIDGRISTELYFWECNRTHTVALPPAGQSNDYCKNDVYPYYDTSVLLAAVVSTLEADAANPLTSGLWVLDDWPSWDGGSATTVLQQIHQEVQSLTPGLPAICGFGSTISAPGTSDWDPSTALNYSNGGCDMVAFYNYANAQSKPSTGTDLDWSMGLLLPAMESSLTALGWNVSSTPLLGIGQAWSGRFGGGYQPGLSDSQILSEATAFCDAGATSIGWYGWTDSGFHTKTQTPANSLAIASGIQQGVAACESTWNG